MTDTAITMKSRDISRSVDSARVTRLPFTIEHIVTPDGAGYDFEWDGASAYLASHDILLTDGHMTGDDIAPFRALDTRRRMTFLPRGVRVEGWAEPVRRTNSFTVLYFDQDWLLDELEVAPADRSLSPSVHFQNKTLLQSMEKLGRLARARTPAPKIMADSLAIMAGADLLRALAANEPPHKGLALAQLDAVRDYVHANLVDDISLGDLAGVTGLSVFHFTRQFKRATGATPYRYVLEARTERAKHIMRDKALPLAVVGQMVGFSSASHFSRAFADIVGVSPREFRDTLG